MAATSQLNASNNYCDELKEEEEGSVLKLSQRIIELIEDFKKPVSYKGLKSDELKILEAINTLHNILLVHNIKVEDHKSEEALEKDQDNDEEVITKDSSNEDSLISDDESVISDEDEDDSDEYDSITVPKSQMEMLQEIYLNEASVYKFTSSQPVAVARKKSSDNEPEPYRLFDGEFYSPVRYRMPDDFGQGFNFDYEPLRAFFEPKREERQGRMLMDLLEVVIDDDSHKFYGEIRTIDKVGPLVIFETSKECARPLSGRLFDALLLNGPHERCIQPTDDDYLTIEMEFTMKEDHPVCLCMKFCPPTLDRLGTGYLFGSSDFGTETGGFGIMTYVLYGNAVEAYLKVWLIRGSLDSDEENQDQEIAVTGSITSTNSELVAHHQRFSHLHFKNKKDVKVKPLCHIPLLRSAISMPLGGSLILVADLNNSKNNFDIAKGKQSIISKSNGTDYVIFPGSHGQILVEVSWNHLNPPKEGEDIRCYLNDAVTACPI